MNPRQLIFTIGHKILSAGTYGAALARGISSLSYRDEREKGYGGGEGWRGGRGGGGYDLNTWN